MIQQIKLTTRSGKKVTGRRVIVASEFGANIDRIWTKIGDIDTLREICRPRASFAACNDTPLVWEIGKSFVFNMRLHGFIPVGRHTIHIVRMDRAAGEIESQEYNDTVTVWNHYIRMVQTGPHMTRYTDIVDLYAGWLTPLAAWWTLKFYRHRQRKWREIAQRL